MHSKFVLPAVALLSLGVAACGGGSSSSSSGSRAARISRSRPTHVYNVALSGATLPGGAAQGRGVAIVAFHGSGVLCWRFAHLHGFTDATTAHIYMGRAVVASLSTRSRLHHQGCRRVSPTLSRAIWKAPSHYSVTVASTKYPAGAVTARL